MASRAATSLLRLIASLAVLVPAGAVGASAGEPPAAQARPFRIEVVDDETGRGVPLVELRTVDQIRYVTDSNGVVAFDEPGLIGLKVFFHVKSHGYEFPKDGFGYRGVALETGREARPGSRSGGSTSPSGSIASPARGSIATAS